MPDYIRTSRAADSLRDIKITPHFLPHTATTRCLYISYSPFAPPRGAVLSDGRRDSLRRFIIDPPSGFIQQPNSPTTF